jgi:hypothetical protein
MPFHLHAAIAARQIRAPEVATEFPRAFLLQPRPKQRVARGISASAATADTRFSRVRQHAGDVLPPIRAQNRVRTWVAQRQQWHRWACGATAR